MFAIRLLSEAVEQQTGIPNPAELPLESGFLVRYGSRRHRYRKEEEQQAHAKARYEWG